jgi:hypothetical protein
MLSVALFMASDPPLLVVLLPEFFVRVDSVPAFSLLFSRDLAIEHSFGAGMGPT